MSTAAWRQQNSESMRQYRRDYYYRNRKDCKSKVNERRSILRKRLFEYKRGLNCDSCPENHPACLDFHHPDGFGSGRSALRKLIRAGASWAMIMKEIRKCVVKCANCHRKWHYEERIRGIKTVGVSSPPNRRTGVRFSHPSPTLFD